jgi:hypothetical protein
LTQVLRTILKFNLRQAIILRSQQGMRPLPYLLIVFPDGVKPTWRVSVFERLDTESRFRANSFYRHTLRLYEGRCQKLELTADRVDAIVGVNCFLVIKKSRDSLVKNNMGHVHTRISSCYILYSTTQRTHHVFGVGNGGCSIVFLLLRLLRQEEELTIC